MKKTSDKVYDRIEEFIIIAVLYYSMGQRDPFVKCWVVLTMFKMNQHDKIFIKILYMLISYNIQCNISYHIFNTSKCDADKKSLYLCVNLCILWTFSNFLGKESERCWIQLD